MNCKETKCFSERLRLLLDERKIKVTEFAKVLGRERQTIHNYISGYSEPRLTDIIRIAKHFGVTSDYLLGINEQHALELVKHGKWIECIVHYHDTYTDEHWDEIYYKCSKCNCDSDCKSSYCRECGARMDGE